MIVFNTLYYHNVILYMLIAKNIAFANLRTRDTEVYSPYRPIPLKEDKLSINYNNFRGNNPGETTPYKSHSVP